MTPKVAPGVFQAQEEQPQGGDGGKVVGVKTQVDEGHALASKHGLAFFETSAKSNVGVDEAFYAIAKQVHDRVELQDASRSKGDISLEAAPVATSRTKRGGCC